MNDRSHITVILDRTGSMQSIRADMVGGFNAFLAAQKDTPHPATLTLVQFDSQDPYAVLHSVADIASVPALSLGQYVPRATTPLYDAMGRGILDLEAWLADQPDAVHPGKIIFVVVTNGQQNASREFDRKRVKRLVKTKKHLGWNFVFLSANLAAFEEAGQIGVDHDSRLYFEKSAQGNDRAWAMASMKISERRSGTADKVVFDDSDRQSAAAPQ